MYHTEGYLDRQTYFHKGHIWSGAMVHLEHVCYVWFVAGEREECCGKRQRCAGREISEKEPRMEARLRHWMQHELVCALERGTIAVQKELNRIGTCLGMRVYLYYRGELFSDSGKAAYVALASAGAGVFLSQAVAKSEYVQEIVAQYKADNRTGVGLEHLGNDVKTSLLRAMSEGMLEQGYFLLWEDRYVV